MILGMGAGLILLMIRRFHMIHYATPLTALIETVNEFSDDPSVANPIPDAVTRSPEFAAAALALDGCSGTRFSLRQRERLADIGEAVAKINHDMRNVLSSATLVADTLIASEDPRARRAAPHVVRSLEQSVVLCQSMMDYLAETPLPDPEIVISMPELADEIATGSRLDVSYDGPERLFLDRTMMARILLNLARNAAKAGASSLTIDIWRAGRLGVVDIADDGPGIPRDQWVDLFLAFRSRSRGGTGLGLAIARDLAVAQGGNLKLTRSTGEGSEFRLQLPVEIFAAEGLPSATRPMIGVDGLGSMSHGKKIQVSCDTSVTKVSTRAGRQALHRPSRNGPPASSAAAPSPSRLYPQDHRRSASPCRCPQTARSSGYRDCPARCRGRRRCRPFRSA